MKRNDSYEVLASSCIGKYGCNIQSQNNINLYGVNDYNINPLINLLSHPDCITTFIDLGLNGIGDVGAAALAKQLPNCKAETLYFLDNNIGPAGAKALAAALPNSQLTSLILAQNKIESDGAIALADALPNSQLDHLDLCGNNIADMGAEVLAAALPNSLLTTLILTRSNIGDQSVNALTVALQHPNCELKDLYLNDNPNITPDSITALAAVLPNCGLEEVHL